MDLFESVRAISDARFRQFGGMPYRQFAAAGEEFRRWDRAAVESRREAVLALLEDRALEERLARYHVERFQEISHRHNQFVVFGDAETEQLREIYTELAVATRELLRRADRARWPAVLASHHARLTSFLEALLQQQIGAGEWAPVCSEYSAALQLELLRLPLHDLLEPVLDLGCGEGANLVRFLRAHGIQAYGVDRSAPRTPYTTRADWLSLPLGRRRWGTVLSHMAFSNHFVHHHHRPDGNAAGYARRYMEILGSLKEGGRFAYAPGLPFIERLLPRDAYDVRTAPVPAGGLYATTVTRRG